MSDEQLTPRQREIWQLYQAGLGQRRIARHLGISKSAVREQLDAIVRKLAGEKDAR